MSSAAWTDLAGDVMATGTNATKQDATETGAMGRYYRIRMLP